MSDVKITEQVNGLCVETPEGTVYLDLDDVAALEAHYRAKFAAEQKCEHGIPFIDLCIAAQYDAAQPATPTPTPMHGDTEALVAELRVWAEEPGPGVGEVVPARLLVETARSALDALATPTPSIEQIKVDAQAHSQSMGWADAQSYMAGVEWTLRRVTLASPVPEPVQGDAKLPTNSSPVPEQPTPDVPTSAPILDTSAGHGKPVDTSEQPTPLDPEPKDDAS